MEARPKRVSKKSAKLLSYEQDSCEHSKKSLKKKAHKAERIDSKPLLTLPKLKIKLSDYHVSPSNPGSSQVTPQPKKRKYTVQTVTSAPETVKKDIVKKKILKKDPVKQEIVKQQIVKQQIVKQQIAKQQIAKQQIAKQQIVKQEIVKQETMKKPNVKKAIPKKVNPTFKQSPLLPTDIEIEADHFSSLVKSTVAEPIGYKSTVAEPIGYKEPEPVAMVCEESDNPSKKRQRKLPAKFADDDGDAETDMTSNKAAKFFETKKAEQKAASASAKQEASKSGKKTKRNRMPTAYTMWCNSYRAKLQAQCPGMDFVSMNKKLGEVWWSIPLKEKNQWKRKAKRLATHGAPKNADSMKYLGSKAIASLQRNNIPVTPAAKNDSVHKFANINPIYKVTQTEPVDVAAHLEIMADTLSTIGSGLAKRGDAKVQGSLTMLLDSFLCGVSSLMALTQQVPELDGDIDPETHRQRMANIAYYIPNI